MPGTVITDLYGADTTISFQPVTIESLPHNVLLDIFGFYQEMASRYHDWLNLVQVCQRWRYVVFASPRRLGLRLALRMSEPLNGLLDIWPPMQIKIYDFQPMKLEGELDDSDEDGIIDNIIPVFEHSDRVFSIDLWGPISGSLLEKLATLMQKPFPVLEDLHLSYDGQTPLVLPDTFLGGSAPRLESLRLSHILFPALPKLLLSARDLVRLDLRSIPHTGYISPEEMVTYLSGLTSLQVLKFGFQSPSSRPDRGSQRPPPLTRVDLPALTKLDYIGVSEYSEDFLARINAPAITATAIMLFNQVNFHIPQLFKFVSRTEALGPVKRAKLYFDNYFAGLSIHHPDSPQRRGYVGDGFPNVGVLCRAFDWKISFLVQICSQLSPLLSSVEQLDIECDDINPLDLQDDVDHTEWLNIFRPFISVTSLDIRDLDVLIAPALQDLTGESIMEVLPALRSLVVTDPSSDSSGSVRQAIEPFITGRHLFNRPVTVHREIKAIPVRIRDQ